MADEVVQTGVKQVEAAAPTASEQIPPATPPTGEQPDAASETEQAIPYARFQEVIAQKNEIKQKYEELDARLRAQESVVAERNRELTVAKHIEKLVEKGVDRSVAEAFVETQLGLVNELAPKPMVQADPKTSVEQEIGSWCAEFAKTHKDYHEQAGEMNKAFMALPERTQIMIASDPKGLELLYSHVKHMKAEVEKAEAFEAGKKAAYAGKAGKAAISSQPGATAVPKTGITKESLKNMTLADYAKDPKAVHAAIFGKK